MPLNKSKKITFDFGLNADNIPIEQVPDRYKSESGIPSPEFIVSRDLNLKPLSRFIDNIWDWSYYTPHNSECKLNFEILRGHDETVNFDNLIIESKCIIFIIAWICNGRNLSPYTAKSYLRLIGKLIAFGASKLGLINALNNNLFISNFMKQQSGFYSTLLLSLYNKLTNISENIIPTIKIKDSTLKEIAKKSKQYYKSHKQHPPIPTRIYTKILNSLNDFINKTIKVLPSLLIFIDRLISDKYLGLNMSAQRNMFHNLNIPLKERVYRDNFKNFVSKQNLDLIEYLNLFGVNSLINFRYLIVDIFLSVKITILAYTGARSVEIEYLNDTCLRKKKINGNDIFIIDGVSSKLHHGIAKKSSWITNHTAVIAINLAKDLSSLLYKLSSDKNEDRLLMPMHLSYLKDSNYTSNDKNKEKINSISIYKQKTIFRKSLYFKITQNDIHELELIDPFRNWRDEKKFKVDCNWNLTAHQFRRSLALYASKSGIVSLTSLKSQLQHLTETMTAYYSNGCVSATNILGGSSDFVDDYNDAQPESEEASYIMNVIMNDEKLFGAHGNWICKKERKFICIEDRQKLHEQFKNRQMAYQETILGGCTTTGPCKEKAMRNLVACLDCTGAVIKPSKLDRVIKSQQNLVSQLDRSSVMYRTENADLKSMEKYRKRIEKRNDI